MKFTSLPLLLASASAAAEQYFNRVATFPVCRQLDEDCNVDDVTTAGKLIVSDDGMTVAYADDGLNAVGFVDIADEANPAPGGFVSLPGEPLSIDLDDGKIVVFTNTSKITLDMSMKEIISTESDIDIPVDMVSIDTGMDTLDEDSEEEGEKDMDTPPVTTEALIVEEVETTTTEAPPPMTTTEAPEPATNDEIVDEPATNDEVVDDTEPDEDSGEEDSGIDLSNWANLLGGGDGRDLEGEQEAVSMGSDYNAAADADETMFSIYNTDGDMVSSVDADSITDIIIRHGHLPADLGEDESLGIEVVGYAEELDLLFVNSKRANLILVYDVSDKENPSLHQVLPTGVNPGQVKWIPERNILVAGTSKDVRDDKYRAAVVVYKYGADTPQYPSLISGDDENGEPIPWSAMSGLSASDEEDTLYTIEDSIADKSRIFKIDTSSSPAVITKAMYVKDDNDVFKNLEPYGEFDSTDLAALINDDNTINVDPEGIVVDVDGGFWLASEGSGTIGDEKRPIKSLNFIIKSDSDGIIEDVVTLPDEVNDIQLRFGLEGITKQDDNLIVAFQRAWNEEENARLGIYNIDDESWKFLYYPLDEPESPNGGWVGLSDITAVGDGNFLVLERDNQGGPDMRIKRIYSINLAGIDEVHPLRKIGDGEIVEKELVKDILDDMKAGGGVGFEKVEGMAYLDGDVWIHNDNDGTSDSSGETQLFNLGDEIYEQSSSANIVHVGLMTSFLIFIGFFV